MTQYKYILYKTWLNTTIFCTKHDSIQIHSVQNMTQYKYILYKTWLNTNKFCTKHDSIHITSVQKPDSVKITSVQKPESMPIISAKSPLKANNFCTEPEWMKRNSKRTWLNTHNFWKNLSQYNFCTKPDRVQISVTKHDSTQLLYKTRLNINNFWKNLSRYKRILYKTRFIINLCTKQDSTQITSVQTRLNTSKFCKKKTPTQYK